VTGLDAYSLIMRQAAVTAVVAALTAPPDGPSSGLDGVRLVTEWLTQTHGVAAVRDLAEELAADLAEGFEALAGVEQRDPLELVTVWFGDGNGEGAAAVASWGRLQPERQPLRERRAHPAAGGPALLLVTARRMRDSNPRGREPNTLSKRAP
jgi:hypothetical protein